MTHIHSWALIGVSLALLGGCAKEPVPSSAATSSTAEAKVGGTVKILGKPVEGAKVAFDPANVNRPNAPSRAATTDKAGHYEITTLVGINSVSVDGKGIGDNPKVGYVSKAFDVQSGSNTFDIEAP